MCSLYALAFVVTNVNWVTYVIYASVCCYGCYFGDIHISACVCRCYACYFGDIHICVVVTHVILATYMRLCLSLNITDVILATYIYALVLVVVREIFRVLDVMLLDMANAQIQQMRPYMKQQSIIYERKKFQDFLVQQEGEIAVSDNTGINSHTHVSDNLWDRGYTTPIPSDFRTFTASQFYLIPVHSGINYPPIFSTV